MLHMCLCVGQVHTWLNDVNQFVNEDDNEFSYSVRLSALDLINVRMWCVLCACVCVCVCTCMCMCVYVCM